MKAILSTEETDADVLKAKVVAAPDIVGVDLVKRVTCSSRYTWNTGRDGQEKTTQLHVVVVDCGVKYNILRELVEQGCSLTVVPASTSSEDIMALKPDGIMFSNGPGDPAAVPYVAETMRKLLGKVPLFGICLGHQMFGLALGGKTYKLKFGHHGGNQPIKDVKTGSIHISVQNHNFCVDIDTLPKKEVRLTHINLNDNTLEGMEHTSYPAFSVQFHPEAAPGPHDTQYLFRQFKDMMQAERQKRKK
jgi:carbamoyl-phosphate synthase small subunit